MTFFTLAWLAPKVTSFPSKTVQESDKNILLVCEVDGFPTPKVTWAFNNLPLPPSESIQTLNKCQSMQPGLYRINPHMLAVCHVEYPQHQGMYTCVATNKKGRHSTNMTLTVLGRLISVGIVPQSSTIF